MWKSGVLLSFLVHCAMSQTVTQVATVNRGRAVNPFWDDDTQSLYFTGREQTQPENGMIFRYSYRDGALYSANIQGVDLISFIIPATKKCKDCNNLFLVGAGSQVITVIWDGISTVATAVNALFSMDANIPSTRTGWGRPSPNGQFYGSAYYFQSCSGTPALNFYRYDPSNGLVRLFGNLISTSGTAFNKKARKLYHMDTCQLLITEFDWDPSSGDICNGRVAFDFKSVGASLPSLSPIGLDIGKNGLLYTAIQTGDVWVINPWTSSLVNIIKVPILGLNGLTFGGPHRDILFLTVSMDVVNYNTSQVGQQSGGNSAVYVVTGVGTAARPSSRVLIH